MKVMISGKGGSGRSTMTTMLAKSLVSFSVHCDMRAVPSVREVRR
ncbi:MAG: hypothetical protein A4E30_00073 [Methanomassiliicoccales archaeon PtaB.Bin215]|nr:MAG: hypothetical protein A4E30_00073 [Methanomassiliicoccales archaeon PtaB.Bin215]